jgi:hypothetical protein
MIAGIQQKNKFKSSIIFKFLERPCKKFVCYCSFPVRFCNDDVTGEI